MQLMVAYRVELISGRTHSGTVAVNAGNAEAACRCVKGLLRGHSDKYGATLNFEDFSPEEVEDVTVTCLGPA